MERLERICAFGNLAELETVLMRTLALVQRDAIDQDDLLFGYGDCGYRGPTAPPGARRRRRTIDLD